MRVSFPRLTDGTPTYAVVHRDDGVTYRVSGQRSGPDLPHDVVHFVVERALGLTHGFWGRVAAGGVFRSMTHVSGRRPPHAADTSDRVKRERHSEITYAEVMAELVERIAELGVENDDAAVRRLTGDTLAALHPPYPEPAAIRRAVATFRETAAQWRALRPGEELTLTWRFSG